MAIRKGLPAKLALTDADDTRYLFSGLVVCNVDGSPRGGVLSPVNVNLVTATATMNVSVARFQGAAVRDGGVILLANDGAANVLLDAAPGANSRIDVIFAKQNDASATVTVPDGDNTPVLGFVKGTASATPTKPALPIGALELATVLIPSGATATNSGGVVITQTAAFTAAAGATVPFRTKTALDLWTTAQKDQQAVVLADSSRFRYTGSAWEQTGSTVQLKMGTVESVITSTPQRGVGKIAGTSGTRIDVAVTFPVAYASVPVVTAAAIGGRANGAFNAVALATVSGLEVVSLGTITTTGFTIYLSKSNGATLSASFDYYFSWSADGVKA